MLEGELRASVDDGRVSIAKKRDPTDEVSPAIESARVPLIVNVDLDYFFQSSNNDEDSLLVFDLDVVRSLFRSLGRRWEKIRVLTIALSPEFCGGWEPAEAVCAAAFEGLGIVYPLPAPPAPLFTVPSASAKCGRRTTKKRGK